MGNADSKGRRAGDGSTIDAHLSKDSNSIEGGSSSFEDYSTEKADIRKRRGSEGRRTGSSTTPTPRRKNQSATVQSRDDETAPSTHISDEQVHVNLAMSDLMAYLQVVANNSNHLPLTRRDDPELDRTVSTLTPEDYARKSAAFVPSDVRVIGGTFTRYGRVWDLPTSEEYNACDGAQEPGRSYGGACSNALLKVLYDSANDTVDEAGVEAVAEALFNDDDDEEEEEEETESTWGNKSGLLEPALPQQINITWAELLRKMKAEIKDIEYAQIPKITTTRKMDLNKPFSLVPENFDPVKGKKRSLLIGCNYKNIPGAELKASHDDVRSMKDYIVNVHGFPETKGLMTILLDDEPYKYPTFLNIVEAFKVLSEESQPGDAVFVQFSGHGGRVLDAPTDSEAESYDEVIVPCDYNVSGLIRDSLIFKTLLAPMRYGVTVTIVIDTCDTGMVMELPYCWSTKSDKRNSVAKLSTNDDFSFVRFLKVVKTLYETSTFTQLGKTVGSALPAGLGNAGSLSSGDDPEMDASSEGKRRDGKTLVPTESILDAIAAACKPSRKASCDNLRMVEECGELSPNSEARKQSLLEQMMNCTLLTAPEEDYLYDDDDTYRTNRTEDDGDTASFDSPSEEESFRVPRRSRGRGRRSRKR